MILLPGEGSRNSTPEDGREREAFPVADYGEIWTIRPAYFLSVGGWANENPVMGTGIFYWIGNGNEWK